MELVRPRALESAHRRCPYCRDELEGGDLPAEPASERSERANETVECAGCRTVHHLACLEELGHCSVMGCGSAAPPLEERRGPEPPLRRIMRQRIRQRVQRIVRGGLFTPVPSSPEAPLEATGDLGEALESLPRLPEPELPPEVPLANLATDAAREMAREVRRQAELATGTARRMGNEVRFIGWCVFAAAVTVSLVLMVMEQMR